MKINIGSLHRARRRTHAPRQRCRWGRAVPPLVPPVPHIPAPGPTAPAAPRHGDVQLPAPQSASHHPLCFSIAGTEHHRCWPLVHRTSSLWDAMGRLNPNPAPPHWGTVLWEIPQRHWVHPPQPWGAHTGVECRGTQQGTAGTLSGSAGHAPFGNSS